MLRLFCWSFLIAVAAAQSCENYGLPSGSACTCPTGFGGGTCSQPACGGDIFQGTQRPVTPSASNNLTAGACTCESGWGGTGCNVCQSANACQTGFARAEPNGTPPVPDPQLGGQNSTLTCNGSPRVFAAGQMSCQVLNPSLQAIYPRSTSLNILRVLNPSLTPIPNTTSFGSPGSVLAHLFYDGVEQFYCQATTCKQDVSSNTTVSWNCDTLRCTCRTGASFCGGSPQLDLTGVINTLGGPLQINCGDDGKGGTNCFFVQTVLQSLFGKSGLALDSCAFGECVSQGVVDVAGGAATSGQHGASKQLSGGVIAGLAVVGALILLSLVALVFGLMAQKKARSAGLTGSEKTGGVSVEWTDVSYVIPGSKQGFAFGRRKTDTAGFSDDKAILDNVSGKVAPGQIMAIIGPSGAGKTTLIEIIAKKAKSGVSSGEVSFTSSPPSGKPPRIGFVPQQDILPPHLTVFEALLFTARLRLPETISDADKQARVTSVMEKLGIADLKDSMIGWGDGERGRGISGGEMRRVTIGVELVAEPDVLILDEPTSGLDSVSAAKVAQVLHALAHDEENPTAVLATIHQPSSNIYKIFDCVLVLSHGRALYSGPGGFAPVDYLNVAAPGIVQAYTQGYNVADYLLEVASDPPVGVFQTQSAQVVKSNGEILRVGAAERLQADPEKAVAGSVRHGERKRWALPARTSYAATFLTQLEVLSGREWKILQRDRSLFLTHVGVSIVLGCFCGGLYFKTALTIAGFQSRVGCLFFLGALIAFSSLSALYQIVEIRPLFLRERSSAFYSPTAWLLSRFFFDVVPLRIIPTIIVSTITYWMAGLAGDAQHFFKFLFVLVLYTLAMTMFNFLLGTFFQNGGIAILLSALSALYQMTFAGFFVHLTSIPPVLRWLQWLCPLKYTLEALSVNEVGSGLMIVDSLQGVPVKVSASLIMTLLFGFKPDHYYLDVLVLFGYIAGFGLGVIGIVWIKVRERR